MGKRTKRLALRTGVTENAEIAERSKRMALRTGLTENAEIAGKSGEGRWTLYDEPNLKLASRLSGAGAMVRRGCPGITGTGGHRGLG